MGNSESWLREREGVRERGGEIMIERKTKQNAKSKIIYLILYNIYEKSFFIFILFFPNRILKYRKEYYINYEVMLFFKKKITISSSSIIAAH